MNPIRFALLAAVSSKPQATEDKISIPEQIKLCTQDGLSRGWLQSAGPFTILGETRTRWINLRDAENGIQNPDGSYPLRNMLDSAQRREFDVLILYHYNRLRELLDAIDKTLQAYNIQMTSHSQWTEPQPPDSYDPLNDIGKTIRFASNFASTSEITEFRRRYKFGMPARILKGFHKGKIPFGYYKPQGKELDRKAIPIAHPLTSPVVLQIKDLYLTGRSLWQIAQYLTAKNIPTPKGNSKWNDSAVRNILKNRYYAGEVHFGKRRRIIDPRTGRLKTIENPSSRLVIAKGLHTPLWDVTTQSRIDEEFKRRGNKYVGAKTARLSNLLHCGVCGSRCWVSYPGGYSEAHRRWACKNDPSHVNIKDSALLPRFIEELIKVLQHAGDAPLPHIEDKTEIYRATVKELTTRRTRLIDAYESGNLELTEFATRKDSLDTQLKEAEAKLIEQENHTGNHNRRTQTIDTFKEILNKIPTYITTAPPQDVNNHLRQLIEKITITPTTVTITLHP